MSRAGTIARRTLLIGAAAVTGGLAVGAWMYLRPVRNPLAPDALKGEATLTPHVWIDRGGVTVIVPRAEMGQGVQTTLAAMVAEEMDLAWDQVKVVHGPAAAAYYNAGVLAEGIPFSATDEGWMARGVRAALPVPAKIFGMQVTGGSTSVIDAFDRMRAAGAVAREMLVIAAALRFPADPASLRTEAGEVIGPGSQRLSYTELALDAAVIPPPEAPSLRHRAQWRLLGRSLPRVDLPAKITGAAVYSGDVRLEGMLFATVRMNPHLGAAMTGADTAKAEAMAGVRRVVRLGGGVAVVADSTWHAMRAADAIAFDWAPATYPAETAGHFDALAAALDGKRDTRLRDDGDVEAALAGEGAIAGEYRVPYLAHATMEVPNATAWLRAGRLDIWAGTQMPTQVVKEGAALTGVDPDRVTVHTTFMGGGFGRRLEMDFIRQAILVAREVEDVPVQLTWTREEDLTHDFYRPAAVARFRARVEGGRPVAADLHVAAPSVGAAQAARLGIPVPGPELTVVQAAWDQPYAIPNYRVTGYRAPDLLPASSWRSVGASQNGFFHEGMMNEIAHAAGADPLQMRLDLVTHEPSRKVLEAVREMSGWGTAPPEGRARGVAFVMSFGVPCAEVVEVAQTPQGLRVTNVWVAVDVGIALDPRNIEAQVTSAVVMGLSAAISGEITVREGRVEQTNFHAYDGLRMYQMPEVQVRVLENLPHIRGIGEPALPPVAPALADAVFALTGQRLRSLPLSPGVAFA